MLWYIIYIIISHFVCYVKVVVKILPKSAQPEEGGGTLCQNPVYYFGIAYEKCRIIILIMLTVNTDFQIFTFQWSKAR